ncbi:MAG TPA: TatD family hydrolase [Streptosporangiaceae bacterium]|nr:TatD family hydrolase [Streptosporangiaceae bacterium]
MTKRPEPDITLPAEALDSHCHLDIMKEPVSQALAGARSAGIRRVVTIGTDLDSSRWAAGCAKVHPDVYAAVAVHPTEVEAVVEGAEDSPEGKAVATDAVLAEIEALAALPKVRAIGETGLDYYWDRTAPKVQQEWFRAHIEIAKRAGKALVIHDRDAHEDVLRILDEQGPPEKVVFHCFSGDERMARQCAEAGYVMSFAGNLTFANAQPLRDAAAAAPAGLLLVETDAPFLTPVPHRGKPNSPWLAAHTLRRLAEVKNMDLAELCGEVTRTAERVFGPW